MFVINPPNLFRNKASEEVIGTHPMKGKGNNDWL